MYSDTTTAEQKINRYDISQYDLSKFLPASDAFPEFHKHWHLYEHVGKVPDKYDPEKYDIKTRSFSDLMGDKGISHERVTAVSPISPPTSRIKVSKHTTYNVDPITPANDASSIIAAMGGEPSETMRVPTHSGAT